MVQTYSTKKRTHVFISAAVLLLLSISILAFVVLRFSSTTSAADKNDWVTNNIISDAEFTNVNSMSVPIFKRFQTKAQEHATPGEREKQPNITILATEELVQAMPP